MVWLRTLGAIQADFSIPSTTFNHNNTPITLQGDSASPPSSTAFHQLKQLLHTNFIASLHLMIFQPTDLLPSQKDTTSLLFQLSPHTDPSVSKLLLQYPSIFQSQPTLPPPRSHDHHIPLLPNTHPITIKPYRYPYLQKSDMTTIIE